MAVRDPGQKLGALHYQARESFEALARAFGQATGLDLQVRSALRSCAEQAELYGIGRTYNLHSPPVTYAEGCSSWHVAGRAVDADPVDPRTGKRVGDCAVYQRAGVLWEQMGGVWGGRWTKFGPCGDAGHFEWHPGLKIADVCPDPKQCAQVQASIVTESPAFWTWAVAGAAIVVGGVWAARRAGLLAG
jgi:hypothetical protein